MESSLAGTNSLRSAFSLVIRFFVENLPILYLILAHSTQVVFMESLIAWSREVEPKNVISPQSVQVILRYSWLNLEALMFLLDVFDQITFSWA